MSQAVLVSAKVCQFVDLASLNWAGDIYFTGYGARILVRFTDPELGAELALRPAIGTRLAARGLADRVLSVFHSGDRYWIFGDDEMKCQPILRSDLLNAFDTHLRAAFAEFSRRKLFVHGGVVGWQGRAIVFPGRSRAGKSTLVAELVKAGASYLSDEYAVLDARCRVHPFAQPLALRDPASACQRRVQLEDLRGVAAREPLPIGLVVMTEYRTDAVWQPVILTSGEAALAILANTIAARRWPQLALSVIGTLVERAPVLRSPRGEARALASTILDLTWIAPRRG
ncbi:hypothetical protein [Novosphingobium aquae]|uniref:Hpr(Ser) kinase/phosphatase n=1 Tax=Novosphingobium aquae TaxID=3133435 RepID=A0ABU8S5W1_9SPHN